MAVIRRIQPSTAISSFPATVNPGPNIFETLSEGMAGFADHFDTRARVVAEQQGREQGAAAAGAYTPQNAGAAPNGLPRSGRYTPPTPGPTINNPISPYRGPNAAPGENVLPISGASGGVDEGLIGMAQQAWGYVMPPGSRIEVSTGVSDHSPNNHLPGRALDFAVYRPDGSRVAWNDPEAVRGAQFFRALGGGGIGAGFDYMGGNSFHWDINAPRVWSDSDGVNDRDARGAVSWAGALAEAEQLGVDGLLAAAGVAPSPAPLVAAPSSSNPDIVADAPPVPQDGEIMPPVTTIRTESGGLETRPIDMFTSRYDMIRQNAALGTYAASVLNNASLAMTDLRRQFPLDPDGFQQAAQGYISQLMRSAPEQIREQMQGDLQTEAGRTLNGILSARYENTLSRARNEIGARIDTTASEYSNLLAQGDNEGAAVARANLESALRYRETLPGSTWGPQQSSMLLAGAEQDAANIRAGSAADREREVGAQLSDIRRERLDGRISASEGVLFTEDAANHPEYLATVATVEFSNFMEGRFSRMPASERAAMIASERGAAVDDYDRQFLGVMEARHGRLLEAERNDGMAASQARGMNIGTLDPSNPATFVQTLSQRRAIAAANVEQGFATEDTARLFTNAERDMLAPMIGEGADPDQRMQMVSALIVTQEEGVAQALRELGAEESVAQLADLSRATGNTTVLQEGLTGASLRATQQARVGNINDMTGVPDVMALVNAMPPNAAMRQTTMEMALDILAFRVQGQEPTEEQRLEAMRSALGQNGHFGGVQEVFGGEVMLPPDMTPETVTRTFEEMTREPVMEVGEDGRINLLAPRVGGSSSVRRSGEREVLGTYDTMQDALAARWEGFPQGVPMIGDRPLRDYDLRRTRLVPVMRGQNVVVGLYRMEVDGANGAYDVTDADGSAYIFNLNSMAGR